MIKFNHKAFLIRTLKSNLLAEVIIASNKLNENLLNENFDYIDSEAQTVDEHIFYFVPDEFLTLSDK